jgi:hypothetical protein
MIKFILRIERPGADPLTYPVIWQVVPRVGDRVDIAPPGSNDAGWTVKVTHVIHWLGHDEIEVRAEMIAFHTFSDSKLLEEMAEDSDMQKCTLLGHVV